MLVKVLVCRAPTTVEVHGAAGLDAVFWDAVDWDAAGETPPIASEAASTNWHDLVFIGARIIAALCYPRKHADTPIYRFNRHVSGHSVLLCPCLGPKTFS